MDTASVYGSNGVESGVRFGTDAVAAWSLGQGVKKRWRLRKPQSDAVAGTLIDSVLASRGLSAGERADRFLNPSLLYLHPPELLPDIDVAAERLLRALRNGEQVVIYGDYDVDGVTATAVLYHTLVHLARWLKTEPVIRNYVPHRLDEGYGLNLKAIQTLADEGARVIVTVDCGVTATGPASAAKAAGVDLIITDHHNAPSRAEDLPDALAVVHPRRPGSLYPRSDLCGAGVAYKLAWRMCVLAQGDRLHADTRQLLVNLLAFTALGTIADVVPLGGEDGEGDENRLFAHFGLTRIRSSPFVGLRALCEAARLTSPGVSEWDVGFKLGPRLNACGRMNHAQAAVELFTTADHSRAMSIAEELEESNSQRRIVEAAIVSQAEKMAVKRGMTGSDKRAIVLAHADWHAGVVGICCSRLVEKYCRPVLLMQLTEHAGNVQAHGSGRSIDGFSLCQALDACSEHLQKHGGHDMAAGLRVEASRLDAFADAFIRYANRHVRDDMLVHAIDIDAVIGQPGSNARGLKYDLAAVKSLDRMKPFGRGNSGVKVLLKGARVGSVRAFGKTGSHAEVSLDLGDAGPGHWVQCICWGAARDVTGDGCGKIVRGTVIDAVIEPRIETYGGEKASATLLDWRSV